MNPLRLEPDDVLHSLLVDVVAQRSESVGVALRVRLPRAGLRPSDLRITWIPACVGPPIIEREPFLAEAVAELDGVLLAAHYAGEESADARGAEWFGGPAADLGRVVGRHPTPPDVLRAQRIAFVELHDDHRAADFLSRVELEVRAFLACGDAQIGLIVPDEVGGPLPRPACYGDHSAAGMLDVEVGERARGGPSAIRCDVLASAGAESIINRLVAIGRAGVAFDPMQNELAGPSSRNLRVQREYVRKNGSIGLARVLEVKRPFDCGEIAVL